MSNCLTTKTLNPLSAAIVACATTGPGADQTDEPITLILDAKCT